jgi:UrcA family protein
MGSRDAACIASNRKVQNMKTSIQLVAGIAIVVAGFSVNSAQAHIDDYAPRTLAVNLHDLDLSTTHGQEVLLRRIRWAADIVCGAPDTRDLRLLAQYHACVSDATDNALAQVKLPRG